MLSPPRRLSFYSRSLKSSSLGENFVSVARGHKVLKSISLLHRRPWPRDFTVCSASQKHPESIPSPPSPSPRAKPPSPLWSSLASLPPPHPLPQPENVRQVSYTPPQACSFWMHLTKISPPELHPQSYEEAPACREASLRGAYRWNPDGHGQELPTCCPGRLQHLWYPFLTQKN